MRIILVGFPNDVNLGDQLIFDCTKYLVKNILEEESIRDYTIKELDLNDWGFKHKNRTIEKILTMIKWGIVRALDVVSKLLRKNIHFLYHTEKLANNIKYLNNYKKTCANADLIIFVGGGIIKYKYQKINYQIESIIDIAKENNCSIMFNAVGIEGYDDNDIRCIRLKEKINSRQISVITTRDDISLLSEKWISNKNIIHAKVADPAIWIPDTYNVDRSIDDEVIGLGVIRPGIFNDNGINLYKDEFLKLWVDLLKTLDNHNIKWKIFTNGHPADNNFAKLILDKANCSDEKLMIPKNKKDLLSIISNFKAVVACRLHASIASYALGIPVLSLVWNSKQIFFAESINRKDIIIEAKDFSPDYIFEKLKSVMRENYDLQFKISYRQSTYEYFRKCIKSII